MQRKNFLKLLSTILKPLMPGSSYLAKNIWRPLFPTSTPVVFTLPEAISRRLWTMDSKPSPSEKSFLVKITSKQAAPNTILGMSTRNWASTN
jgi:hypothetical protein